MKLLPIILLITCMLCKAADKATKDSPYRLNMPSNVDSSRKRSKSLAGRLLSEQQSSPRSKDIFTIWNSKPNEPVLGVSATLCKVVRSKSVPQVDVEAPQTQEQSVASAPS